MQTIFLKFHKIQAKMNMFNNSLDLIVHYYENEMPKTMQKSLFQKDNINIFVPNLIKEIRSQTQKNNKPNIHSDNPLDNFISIVLDEKDLGNTEEKMIFAIRKIIEQIRTFKTNKSAENYMNRLFDVSKLEVKL